MSENQTKQSAKERLKEITDSIEVGIKEMYESDKYAQYLRTMSRFHKYSLNNTILIATQRPEATVVAGFNRWRDSFKRTVKRGEKGIKIIAPTPYKVKEQQTKLDPLTKAPLLDENGKVQIEEVEKQIPMFRVVSVFDVDQTFGEPLPTLASDLTGNVERYDVFIEAVKRSAPVPITFEKMPETTDGYYHSEEKRIAIRENMSEKQTVSATIHEVAHSLLHDRQSKQEQQAKQDETAPPPPPIDRRTEEVQAESISFAVCSYYGIETGENSFGYIANWSKGKELSELKASLEVINKTSSQLITDIDRHFVELVKERMVEIAPEQPPLKSDYKMPDPTVTVQDAINYGYTAPELLPLNKGRAIELFDDIAIFALYPDNTEAQVCEISEIEEHNGFFGIEKLDWENLNEFKQREVAQPTQKGKTEQGFKEPQNYLKTAEELIEQNYNYIDGIINNKPDEFASEERINTPRGSFALTSMTEEQLRQAGYGFHHSSDDGQYHIMGDGTRAFAIRNEDYTPLPTVAQLEHDAKNGKPVSLIELLDATKREQQAKPPHKKEKTAPSKGAETER